MTEGKLRMTIIAAAFALAVALTPAHTAAEIVVLPAEQRGRDLVLEFDARFAAVAPRDLVLRLGFAPVGRPDAQPADLRFSRTSISFAGNWTRTFDFIGSGNTGTPDKAGVEEFERGGFGGNVRIPDYGMNFTSGRANFPMHPKFATAWTQPYRQTT